MLACEHEGDRITHDIIQRLNQTFVTPIDREDIYALASALDDIVDFIEEVADFLGLYRIEAPMEQAQALARILHQSAQAVAGAIPRLRTFRDIHHYTVEINRLENDGDRIVREALASLFERGIDPMLVIRWKDIFERLEDAIDATETPPTSSRASSSRTPDAGRLAGTWTTTSSSGSSSRPRSRSTSPTASTTPPTRSRPRSPRGRCSPRVAVTLAAVLNFVGAFLSLAVAATVAKGIVEADLVTPAIVFAGLVGAIAWNLATWYFGLPSSSSHALIGGVVGAAFAAEGAEAVLGDGLLEKVVVPALVAPVLALVVAGIAILVAYRIVGRQSPGTVARGFRLGQIVSGSLFSLSHGTNDAQKTMGIIFLALVANGNLVARRRRPDLGRHLGRDGDRAGHLRRRLADHPHDGQPDHQDGPGPGLRRPGRRRRGDPLGVARRLPALDHPRHLRRDHGRRRGQAALGGALGRGRATS